MDSVFLETCNAGIIYLYCVQSKKELYSNLQSCLSELFGNVPFSILVPGESYRSFYLEYSCGTMLLSFERIIVESEDLAKVFMQGKDVHFTDSPCPVLTFNGKTLPIKEVKVIKASDDILGLLVLHEALPRGEDSASYGLEGYFFDHVNLAFHQVAEKEGLLERLQESDAKLVAIEEIGELLGELNLDRLLSHLIAVCTRLSEAQVGSVILDGNLAADVEWGLNRQVLDKLRTRGGPSICDLVRDSRKPFSIQSYAGNPEYEPVEECHIESVLCVPLISKEKVLGIINLVNADQSKGGVFTGRDETSIVTISSLAATAIENAILHRDSIEKERIEANMQIARRIQRGMYPLEALDIPGYDMAWLTKSCDETGGDYFDFLVLGPHEAGFAVGDVSGHGIGAALLMATGRANLRALLSVKSDLKEVMERLNDLLSRDLDSAKFMTMFFGVLDHQKQTISYVNAGHDPPLIYSTRGDQVVDLKSTGLPLGMMPGWSYEMGIETVLGKGDTLLMTTDGVWEATSRTGERFGKERLRASLRSHAEGSAKEIVSAIMKDVDLHTQGTLHPDDLTLVVLKKIE